MSHTRQSLEQILQKQVDNLSLTLQPFTVVKYQYVARYFVAYLRENFPEVRRLSQLRRDPHMLGWFRWLSWRSELDQRRWLGRLSRVAVGI